MSVSRPIVALITLCAITPAAAREYRPNLHLRDRLAAMDGEYYLPKQWQATARRAEALVVMGPTFAPGYIVGVTRDANGWRLIGSGSPAKGPEQPFSDTPCSRPIGQALGRKTLALWRKVLAPPATKFAAGLDGETYSFVLKSPPGAGWVWSPTLYQPRMMRLTQIADGMFASCLTGKGLDALDRQMSELFVRM